MLRVLEECDHVAADFRPDPVHDLRVSLRRCRSLADGLNALDPDPNWKAMRKAGKRLFQRLGALRDIQIMMEWIEKLHPEEAGVERAPSPAMHPAEQISKATPNESSEHSIPNDPPAQALLKILAAREQEQKLEAHAALEECDRKQWRQWTRSLPARAARLRPGSALFKHIALERWTEARELHNRALRNRSQTAFHNLRIGIKRFRYIVENFLPAEHKAWSNDLKEMQDLLGEVHDLDILWATAVSCHIFPDPALPNDGSRQQWRERILSERTRRIERYRKKMIGNDSLWQVWRAGLPQGKQIQVLATRRMKLWANGLDPDFAHSERVASLALQLYDGLLASGWQPSADAISARSSLLVAALLHDVGKSRGDKGHHKTSFDMIRAHGNPLGWKAGDLQRAAVVARFHRGPLPTRKHIFLRDLLPDEQKATIQLAAILRLANAFDAAHDGHIRRVQIQHGQTGTNKTRTRGNEALLMSAEGYSPLSASAQTIAAGRHLLETVLHRPVVVKPMKTALRSRSQPARPLYRPGKR